MFNTEKFYNCAFCREVGGDLHCVALKKDYCKYTNKCNFFKTKDQLRRDQLIYGDGSDYEKKYRVRKIKEGKLWD